MQKRRQIIIGSGTAGLAALKQLRKAGCDDEVAVVTMEKHAPYSPMSLPYVVSGKVKATDIGMVPEGFFDAMAATLVREKQVTGVLPKERKVLYKDGKSEHYDRLLIATGSDPIVPPVVAGAGGMGFHVMDDCLALMGELKGKKRITLVGAGLVAMELAAALAERGREITVIAPRERILRSYFDEEASGRIADLFAASGVKINLSWGEAVAAEKTGAEIRVSFSNGGTVETDILLACIGVKPRVSFLKGSGIKTRGGIVVDRGMRSNVPEILAAGDAAEAVDFFTGRTGFNPILPNAVDQGKIAGSTMAGNEAAYPGSLAMNVFNFFGHLATSIGRTVPAEGDDVLVERANGRYGKLICSGERLLGAAFLDADIDAGVIHYLIKKGIELGKHRERLLASPREVGLWLMSEAEKKDTLSMEE